MCWPSFFIGFGVASALATFAWMIVSAASDLRAEDAARAAPADQPETEI